MGHNDFQNTEQPIQSSNPSNKKEQQLIAENKAQKIKIEEQEKAIDELINTQNQLKELVQLLRDEIAILN